MNPIKDLKLGVKLYAAFFLVVAVFVAAAAYQISAVSRLGELQDRGSSRARRAEEALDIAKRVETLYTLVGDAAINRNLKETRKAFTGFKTQAEKDTAQVREMADTDDERRQVEKFATSYAAYIEIVEKKLLPYLESGGQDLEEIRGVDARIDALRDGTRAPLEQIVAAIQAESLAADQTFDAVRKATVSTSLAVFGAGVLLAALVALVVTLGIARPLKKATAFALDLAAGVVDKDLPVRRRDEVGEVCWALRRIAEAVRNMQAEFDAVTGQISLGRLRARGDAARFKGAFASLIGDANRMADTLVGFLDMVPAPLMAIDNDFNVQFMNTTGAKAGGADPVKLQGSKCHEHFRTDDCRTPGCACDKAMKARAAAGSATTARPGGNELEITYAAAPIIDKQGRVVGAFEIVTDQTEVRRAQKKMQRLAHQARGIASNLSSAAEEISAQVEESSRGSDTQRERAAETATAMEQMNATVMEVAQSASSAAAAADATRSRAREGARDVEDLVKAVLHIQGQMNELSSFMSGLGQQAEGISRILNVISDIADQTNLLALNAAIEAARAGDAGRGFAVVADEVRKLAEKTMTATKEVGDAIAAIQDGARKSIDETQKAAQAVAGSADKARASGAALTEIVGLADQTSDQVRSIATASEQQSAASEQINRSTEEINRISTETAETMSQSAGAVVELARLAQELGGLIQEMNA